MIIQNQRYFIVFRAKHMVICDVTWRTQIQKEIYASNALHFKVRKWDCWKCIIFGMDLLLSWIESL